MPAGASRHDFWQDFLRADDPVITAAGYPARLVDGRHLLLPIRVLPGDGTRPVVYRLGSTGNGVFGAKIHWNNLRWALQKFSEMPQFAGLDRAATVHRAFPGLRVVHLTRRDRVRQAVSWARMAQDGMWVAPAGQPEPPWPPLAGVPRYDYELIATLESLIAEGEAGWRQLYAELELTPCQVTYEDLASPQGYEPAIRGVLAHLGLDGTGPIPAPQTRRQSNDLNEAWTAAYLADRPDSP